LPGTLSCTDLASGRIAQYSLACLSAKNQIVMPLDALRSSAGDAALLIEMVGVHPLVHFRRDTGNGRDEIVPRTPPPQVEPANDQESGVSGPT
jgi:hypothetical protein